MSDAGGDDDTAVVEQEHVVGSVPETNTGGACPSPVQISGSIHLENMTLEGVVLNVGVLVGTDAARNNVAVIRYGNGFRPLQHRIAKNLPPYFIAKTVCFDYVEIITGGIYSYKVG